MPKLRPIDMAKFNRMVRAGYGVTALQRAFQLSYHHTYTRRRRELVQISREIDRDPAQSCATIPPPTQTEKTYA